MSAAGQDDPAVDAPPLDRSITPLSGEAGWTRFGRAAGILGIAVVCGLIVLSPWKRRPEAKTPSPSAPRQTVAFEAARAAVSTPDTEPPTVNAAVVRPGQSVPAIEAANGAEAPRPAPVLAWSAGKRSVEGARLAAIAEEAVDEQLADGFDEDGARQRVAASIRTAKARRLGDQNFLITAGRSVPCVLQTAMDSSLPGQVVCLVDSDVWSDNGAVVLLDKGARVLGQYRQGLKTGEGRLFVLWSRVVTPGGVAVDLASPAADGLGRAGFGGDVDRHFWRRFGGAVLMSIVDDAAVAAFEQDRGRGRAARLPSDATALALDRSIDLPPTLRKPQGARVSIMVAQDLDFSDVYRLETR